MPRLKGGGGGKSVFSSNKDLGTGVGVQLGTGRYFPVLLHLVLLVFFSFFSLNIKVVEGFIVYRLSSCPTCWS